jgi:PilZ domain
MALTRSSPADSKTWIADPGRRRSMRVLLSVPISVNGKNARGQTFTEETRTLVVNAHGALISLAAAVAAEERISVSNKATQKTVECKVVHLGSSQAGKVQMGIEFERPCPSFWQIDFPPDDWVVPED